MTDADESDRAHAEIDDGVSVDGPNWDFRPLVPVFDQHMERSIPMADASRDYVAALSRHFLAEGARAYELGVSTGRLAEHVLTANSGTGCRYIGLDAVAGMTTRAAERLAGDPRFEAVTADITHYEFAACDLVLGLYTLHFIDPQARARLLARLHEALRPGGALILYEKVHAADLAIDSLVQSLYIEHKRRAGFSQAQIDNKRRLLQGAMFPVTTERNLELLHEAGFRRVEIIHRFHCFEGYLAIKS